MLRGTYPGVYTREISSGVRSIAGVPTAVTAFVGPTRNGIDDRPIRIFSFADFERSHGGLASDSELSYGVLHFFQNGGGEAVILRVPREGAASAKTNAKNSTAAALAVAALSSGASGNDIFLDIEAPRSITGADAVTAKSFTLTATHGGTGVRESFSDLSTDASSLRYGKAIVNDPDLGSNLVAIDFAANAEAPLTTGTVLKIRQAPAFFAATSAKAAEDYSIKVRLQRILPDGSSEDLLAETELDLFKQNDEIPRTHLGLGKAIEQVVNQKLSQLNTGVSIEAQVLDFGSPFGQVLRLRTKVLAFQTAAANGRIIEHPAPDGIVSLSDGGKPAAGDKLLALYQLDAPATNVSRYRLGRKYAAGLSQTDESVAAPGTDGSGPPTQASMLAGIEELRKVDIFNLVCIPDAVRAKPASPDEAFYADYASIYDAARAVCEDRRAFLLIDTPPNVKDVFQAQAWKTSGFSVRTTHAAAYFPRLKLADPLNPGMLRAFPPSGAMAGVIARTDANRGVWKAPAGIDTAISGVYAPAVVMNDEEHGLLNPAGVNCFRKFPVYGSVAFGARTLAGSDDEASEWKYIPVRRTALYILESLRRGLTWVTFEPNDEPLWGQIRMNVGAFMQGMFRQSAFQGRAARDAYLVKCDSETTTQADINLGMVNVVVGFAPLKPAEFVFVTLQQLAGQAQR